MSGSDGTEKRVFKAGSMLVSQGQPASEAYLIQQGRVCITQQKGEQVIELGVAGPGEIIGEMALLNGGKIYGATVEVTEETHVIVIDAHALKAIYDDSNPVMRIAIFCLVNRLYKANARLFSAELSQRIA